MSKKKVHECKKFYISFKLDVIAPIKTVKNSVKFSRTCKITKQLYVGGFVPRRHTNKQRCNWTRLKVARKRLPSCECDADLDKVLYNWFVQEQTNGALISVPTVC